MIRSRNVQAARVVPSEKSQGSPEAPVLQATYGAGTRRSAASWLSAAACGLLIIAASWFLLRFVYGFAFDDSFIIFRYVENFAAGLGLAYSPGDRVEGFSCPLWIVLLGSIASLSGVDAVAVSRWTGFALWVTTLLFTYCIALRSIHTRKGIFAALAPFIAMLVVVPALASISFLNWAVSGMETSLYSMLLVLYIYFLTERRAVAAAATLCALMLTRPEAAMFGALGFSLLIPRSQFGRLVKENRAIMLYGAITVGFLAVVTLLRLLYFNDFVPNTVRLKTPGTLVQAFSNGVNYLQSYSMANPGLTALFVLPVLVLPVWIKSRLAMLSFVTVVMELIFILFVGGDWMGYWRFVAPFVPVAGLFVFEAVLTVHSRLVDGRNGRPAVRLAGGAVVLGLLLLMLSDARRAFAAVTPANYKLTGIHYELGTWLRRNSPPNALLAVGDAGEIPFHSKLPLLDLHGLMDQHLARLEKSFNMNPHSTTDPYYVLSRKPVWIVSIGNPFTPEQLSAEIRAKDISNIYGLYDQLMDHPDFDAYYRHTKQFCLSPAYCYQLFHDTRQISFATMRILLASSSGDRAEAYAVDYPDRRYSFPTLRDRNEYTVELVSPQIRSIRVEPISKRDSTVTIWEVEVSVNGERYRAAGDAMKLHPVNMEQVPNSAPGSVTFRVTAEDPMLIVTPGELPPAGG